MFSKLCKGPVTKTNQLHPDLSACQNVSRICFSRRQHSGRISFAQLSQGCCLSLHFFVFFKTSIRSQIKIGSQVFWRGMAEFVLFGTSCSNKQGVSVFYENLKASKFPPLSDQFPRKKWKNELLSIVSLPVTHIQGYENLIETIVHLLPI